MVIQRETEKVIQSEGVGVGGYTERHGRECVCVCEHVCMYTCVC